MFWKKWYIRRKLLYCTPIYLKFYCHDNPQPTTHNPQPTTHNPQPTTHNPQLAGDPISNEVRPSALTFLKQAVSLTFTILTIYFAQGQVYINTEWIETVGQPQSMQWSHSVLDENDNLFTVGNTIDPSGSMSNLLLVKQNSYGYLQFSYAYDGPASLNDYGAFVSLDESGNIYLACVSEDSVFRSHYVSLIKLNSSGTQQWVYSYADSSEHDDVPYGLIVRESGVYLGVNENIQEPNSDIKLIKVNEYGAEQWVSTYDYAELIEFAVGMEISETDDIKITGISQETDNEYKVVSLGYDDYGNLNDEFRSDNSVDMDEPTCMSADSIGNIYIGGNNLISPGNSEIVIVSLTDSLTLNWVENIDVSSGLDQVRDIKVLRNGNIVFTGSIEETTGFQAYTSCIDDGAMQQWDYTYYNENDGSALGYKISENDSSVIIAGLSIDVDTVIDTNYLVLQVSTLDGQFEFAEETDLSGDVTLASLNTGNDGTIYISGYSGDEGSSSNTMIKYSPFVRGMEQEADSNSHGFRAGEVLLRVNPNKVNLSFVDNKLMKFGQLNEIFDAGLVSDMANANTQNFSVDALIAIKAFPEFTSPVTTTVSRLGDTVAIDTLWNYFILQLPDEVDEETMVQDLSTVQPDVLFCELNHLGYPDTYDPEILNGNQISLLSAPSYPDAGINILDAWNIWTGSWLTSIGIVDGGIEFSANDFSNKIVNGWDFFHNVNHVTGWLNRMIRTSHGTSVAGIAGAVRNNTYNIAGIAGGSFPNLGCTIMDFAISNDKSLSGGSDVATAAQALIQSTSNSNVGGYNTDIINFSSGSSVDSEFFKAALKVMSYNGATFVASRGNEGTTAERYPVCSGPDLYAISVGASAGDGKLAASFQNKPGKSSSYGNEMDIVAPGHASVVRSINMFNQNVSLDGTSFAAPHASGTAALMADYIKNEDLFNGTPNLLAPEDIEILIEKNAKDLTIPLTNEYTSANGWGRLDAGKSLESIKFPDYLVKHYSNTYTLNGSNTTKIISGGSVYLPALSHTPANYYNCDVYKVEITESVPNVSNYTFLDAWVRNSSQDVHPGLFNYKPVLSIYAPDGFADVSYSLNGQNITFTGYIYNIVGTNIWYPYNHNNINQAQFQYTAYYRDTYLFQNEEKPVHSDLNLYPNPARSNHVLFISNHQSRNASIQLYNNFGQLIENVYQGEISSNFKLENKIDRLTPGLYIYLVDFGNKTEKLKFIKN